MEDNMSHVEVIICVKDNWDYLKEAIDSVLFQTYPNLSCTVVDDGSVVSPPEHLNGILKKVKFIKNNINRGASAARNIGVRCSNADYFVILDDDATLSKDWVGILVDFMGSNKNCGICTGKLIKKGNPNMLLSAGGAIKPWLQPADIGYGGNPSLFNDNYEILYACSASLMIRKEAFDIVKGFDEILSWGLIDPDIGWRVRLSGFHNYYVKDAVSYHEEKGFSRSLGGQRGYFKFRGYLRIILKNCSVLVLIKRSPIVSLFIFAFMFSNFTNFKNTFKAIFWNIKVLPDTYLERQHVNKIRKAKDVDILKIGRSIQRKYYREYSFISRVKRFSNFFRAQ